MVAHVHASSIHVRCLRDQGDGKSLGGTKPIYSARLRPGCRVVLEEGERTHVHVLRFFGSVAQLWWRCGREHEVRSVRDSAKDETVEVSVMLNSGS